MTERQPADASPRPGARARTTFLLLAALGPCAAAWAKEPPRTPPPPPVVPGYVFPLDAGDLAAPLVSTSAATATVPWYPEYLLYDVKYGFLKAGQATLEVTERDSFNGRPAFHIRSRTLSNSTVDHFYRVRDLSESWIDSQQLWSLGFSKHLREGSYAEDSYILFDPDRGTYMYQKSRPDRAVQRSTGSVPSGVQDILSSMYFLRTRDLEVGRDIIMDVNSEGNWPLVIKVLRKDTVTVPAGTFNCFVVQPMMRKQGIFIQKGKDLFVWLSDDAYKRPIKVEVEVFIGHISAKLTKIAAQAD